MSKTESFANRPTQTRRIAGYNDENGVRRCVPCAEKLQKEELWEKDEAVYADNQSEAIQNGWRTDCGICGRDIFEVTR